jgi:hypothetical protein
MHERLFVRLAGSIIGLLLATGVGAAGQPAAEAAQDAAPATAPEASADAAPSQIFRSGINYIRVDVIATDEDGNHVTDLTLRTTSRCTRTTSCRRWTRSRWSGLTRRPSSRASP